MGELFEKHFAEIEDSRCKCDVKHKLVDILIQVMCVALCGLDRLDGIVTYEREKITFLSKNFGIEKMPSKSTLTRIMNMINGDVMATILINIMKNLLDSTYEIVAIDRKTIRSTTKKKSAHEKFHILLAHATKNGVTLG